MHIFAIVRQQASGKTGRPGLHEYALSQKTNKHGKPAMNALNHSNIHVITLLLVVLRR